MSANVQIEFDERTKKLRVRCPIYANDVIMPMESRSWSKAQRAWLIPISRANCDYLQSKLITPGLATITDEARLKLNAVEVPKSTGDGFPSWYKFKTTPRKHQGLMGALKKYGVKCLAMFMIMRAGKTKVTIDMACALRMEDKIDAVLVICKLSIRRTWEEQYGIHAPIPAQFMIPKSATSSAFNRWLDRKFDFPWCIVGTESLSQGNMAAVLERFFHDRRVLMVVDESSYISNHTAIRAIACVELGERAEYRMALTGTPISVGPMNLFMQFEFLDTNILGIGDYYAFRNRYAVMGGFQKEVRPGVKKPTQIVGYQNMEELTKLIAPFTFEVGEDELDLPEKVMEKRYVTMAKPQRALYDMIRKETVYKWKGQDVVIKNVLELYLRLHQVAGGWTVTRAVDHRGKEKTEPHAVIPPAKNPKILELLDIVDEVNGKSGIVWCAYKPELLAVATALRDKGLRVGVISGDIDEDVREATRRSFQRRELDWIVSNTATGSMGLDMSAASLEVFFSNTNRMIDRKQAEERARAEGKKESVLIIDLIMEGTVDEDYLEAMMQKMDLSDYVKMKLRESIALLMEEWKDE